MKLLLPSSVLISIAASILSVNLLVACGGGSASSATTSNSASDSATTNNDAPATENTTSNSTAITLKSQGTSLQVPSSLQTGTFASQKSMQIAEGYAIRLEATVGGARFMALASNGDLLVSNPGAGQITLLRFDSNGLLQSKYIFAQGLKNPQDMVFYIQGGKTYLYIAESNRIIRSVYQTGSTQIGNKEVIVSNLPDASSAELNGAYGHQLKNIAVDHDKLFVAIASTCNACESDVVSDPIRNAIYEYDLTGANRRLVARGLRNVEGLAFRPGTQELWVSVNNRDNIAYPFHHDWDGDGKDDYGRVMQSYVDGHPPDLLTQIKDGGNYGWPYCNSNPDAGLNNMPFDLDVQFNADGSKLDCSKADRITRGLPPHSAALGISFANNAGLPAPLNNGIFVALHGCWNCTAFNGHKVVYYPLLADSTLGDSVDLVSGFVTDPNNKSRWGRPVDVIADGKGGLFISDDMAGAIYRFYPK